MPRLKVSSAGLWVRDLHGVGMCSLLFANPLHWRTAELYTLCDPCHVSIYSLGNPREIMNTNSYSPKEEFHVMELPQSSKMQSCIIDPIYPLVTQSRSRLDSSYLGSKRLSLSSSLSRAALSIRGEGATPKKITPRLEMEWYTEHAHCFWWPADLSSA